MIISKTLPTTFAQNLAENVGLYISDKMHDDYWLWADRLIVFQQMACSSPYEMCEIAYRDIALDENQIIVLKFIHETTKPWLMGHGAGECEVAARSDQSRPGSTW